MRKLSYILFIAVIICCFYFRNDILFRFQYYRLQKVACKNEGYEKSLPCFTNKFWAHRVNSLKRFELLKDYFNGFESDIYFDSNIHDFWVWHPPGKRLTNLHLAPLLQAVKTADKKMWFDMRGVDSSNIKEALIIFENYMRKYDIKRNIIIELYDVAAANAFAKKGFVTSLNIPVLLLQANNSNSIQQYKQRIADDVQFVSNSIEYTSRLKAFFPEKKIITWSISFNNYFHAEDLQKLQYDSTISVILVNVKSRYYD